MPHARPRFNPRLRLLGSKERFTADGGAPLLRQVLDELRIIEFLCLLIVDSRDLRRITYPFAELLRMAILLDCLGYHDQDDLNRLKDDPALRLSVSGRRGAAPLKGPDPTQPTPRNPPEPLRLNSPSTESRLMAVLSQAPHLAALRMALVFIAVRKAKVLCPDTLVNITVDVDSLPVSVEGRQLGAEYNGYYHDQIYHPLIAFLGDTGDLVGLKLRHGACHTAQGALEFILELVSFFRQMGVKVTITLRLDAGFPDEELLKGLEDAHLPYEIRVKHNTRLDELAGPGLQRAEKQRNGTEQVWFEECSYRAKDWSRERRMVLVFKDAPGETHLTWFWIVTNWTKEERGGEAILGDYRRRGKAEGHIGELKSTLQPKLSSTNRKKTQYKGKPIEHHEEPIEPFDVNEARALVAGIAYQVMHTLRTALAKEEKLLAGLWSLQTLREQVLKVVGKVVVHARTVFLKVRNEAFWIQQRFWRSLEAFRVPS